MKISSKIVIFLTLMGSLSGVFSTSAMGFRYGAFGASKKSLIAAAGLLGMGSGTAWGTHTHFTKQKYQKSQFAGYTNDNHPFDLNKVGLAHSLPKKETHILTPAPKLETPTDVQPRSLKRFGVDTAIGFGLSYAAHSQDEEPLPGAVQDTAISLVSQGLGYAVDEVAGVPMELGDEIGSLVHNEITKNGQTVSEQKKNLLPSVTGLVVKLGLVWGLYHGLKQFITYATGYKCACPSLGTGFWGSTTHDLIEFGARSATKAAIAAYLIRPAFVLAGIEKPVQEPLIPEQQPKKKKKHKKSDPTVTPVLWR